MGRSDGVFLRLTSQTAFHLSVYGDYGLGLTKEWGKANGIAPVSYTYSQSILSQKLAGMMNTWAGAEDPNKTNDSSQGPFDDFYDLMCFVKPYAGNLWREGRVIPNLRFYNEREWRFVPQLLPHPFRNGLSKDDFLDEIKRRVANDRIASVSRISFEPKILST